MNTNLTEQEPDHIAIHDISPDKCVVLGSEWEAFCKSLYDGYKHENPPPFIAHFLSFSAYANAYDNWGRGWDEYCQVEGEKWWNERGYTVSNWPRHGRITVIPRH